jgi:hypothetical protein
MKSKLTMLCILLCALSAVNAQKNIPKGSMLLGGNIYFHSDTYKDDATNNKSSGFGIAAAAGLAVKDNLFVGAGVNYSHAKYPYSSVSSADSTRANYYGASIFVRKYKPLKSNFYIFLEGSAGATFGKVTLEKDRDRDFYQKSVSASLGVTPGISYAINSKMQVEMGFNSILGVNYVSSKFHDNYSTQGEVKSSNFNAYTSINNFSSQIFFGFRFLLQKDKTAPASKQG